MKGGDGQKGWTVVAAGASLLACFFAWVIGAFGAYSLAISADAGWDPRVLAIAYALIQLGNGLLAPVAGMIVDRIGPRPVATVGIGLAGVGLVIASQATGSGQFVAAMALVAIGFSGAGPVVTSVAVVRTVFHRRSWALALLFTGGALGGMAVPLVVTVLERTGWRTTFIAAAMTIGLVGAVAGYMFPGRPDRRTRGGEQRQLSGHVTLHSPEAAQYPDRDEGQDATLGRAVLTSTFWLLVLGHGSALVTVGAVGLHLIPHLVNSYDYSVGLAGTVMAIVSVCQLCGQLTYGPIAERYDERWIAVACMLTHSAGMVLLAVYSQHILVFCAAGMHGLAWGLRGPIMTDLRADYFGLQSFGSVMGLSQGLVSLGLAAGPVVAAMLASTKGGYEASFLTLGATTGVGAIAFIFLHSPGVAGRY